MPRPDDPHYVVKVENMPITKLVCKCGIAFSNEDGEDFIERMRAHIEHGNAFDATS